MNDVDGMNQRLWKIVFGMNKKLLENIKCAAESQIESVRASGRKRTCKP